MKTEEKVEAPVEEKDEILQEKVREEVNSDEINKENLGNIVEEPKSKKKEFLQFLKFLAFSISAGVIQILSFELLYDIIGWKEWWACHLISLTLSVVWNFTFNRKFTFKSSNNVPIAMSLVILYYCAFTPASVFGGNALKEIGWNGTLVEALMMIINFVTEFVWDKFIVFNEKIVGKIESLFKRKKKEVAVEEKPEASKEDQEDNT